MLLQVSREGPHSTAIGAIPANARWPLPIQTLAPKGLHDRTGPRTWEDRLGHLWAQTLLSYVPGAMPHSWPSSSQPLHPSIQSHYHPPPRHTLQLSHTPQAASLVCPTLHICFPAVGELFPSKFSQEAKMRSNPFLVESVALPSPMILQC